MIAQRVVPGVDPPGLLSRDTTETAERWTVDCETIRRVRIMAADLPYPLEIISGYRNRQKQAELIAQGKGAADELSNHRSCPATAVDLWIPGVTPVAAVKAAFGAAAQRAGLRWGGGSPLDANGIPSDWNHVDLGPRRR